MAEPVFVERVEILEQRVAMLETIPPRVSALEGRMSAVESQIAQLRAEMHDEFSSTRLELLRRISASEEETRRFMRVLHEEVIGRIATIAEVRPRRPKR